MSIAAIGGVSHPAAFAPVGATRQPESAETRVPDHDGDSDDAAAKGAQASSRSVDVRA